MVQYMQNSNQAWSHMFHDYVQALHVDTSGWLAMPLFQPPPSPQLVPPPPPPPFVDTNANIQAQREEEEAVAADDPMGNL